MVVNRDGILLKVSIDGTMPIIVNHSRAEHWSGEKYVLYFTSELPLTSQDLPELGGGWGGEGYVCFSFIYVEYN